MLPVVNAFMQLDINFVEELIPSFKKILYVEKFRQRVDTANTCFSAAGGQHTSNHAAHYTERDYQPSPRPLYSSCWRFNATSSHSVHPGEAMWSRALAGRSIFYFFFSTLLRSIPPCPRNQPLCTKTNFIINPCR